MWSTSKKLFKKNQIAVILLIFLSLLTKITYNWASTIQQLPKLGDSVSGVISPEKEYKLGRSWLRALRGQTSLIYDPLLNQYLENLIYRLASYSELHHPKLEIVIINNSSINAFAVPGGVIGINAGLFLHAENEDELAAVLAHELAHLSQRHFARNLEKAKRGQWTTLAALLASVAIIASTGGADTGLAALATTQAAAIQSQLTFSRQNEREADRLGMLTLVKAEYDPAAMPRFFERMQKSTQYSGEAPPEFLLTHPVTESRISDSYNRVIKLPALKSKPSLDFQLMKARVLASYAHDKLENVNTFRIKAKNATSPDKQAAYQYGLVRSLLKVNNYKEALKTLKPLRAQDTDRIIYIVTEAEIYMAQEDHKKAKKTLSQGLRIAPDNYSLSIYYAQVLLRLKEAELAAEHIEKLLLHRTYNAELWRLLSEAYGSIGNIVGVHQARAEVFFLHNRNDQAIQQLRYALSLAESDFQRSSKIKSRMREIQRHKKDLRL